jgi:2-polyprenyl-3-methyl-5-hydroxy-6-metoxy-1,4-benzoquinol methylase
MQATLPGEWSPPRSRAPTTGPRAAPIRAHVTDMHYFDRIWAEVPPGAEPERFALRRDFLLAGVAPGERVLDIGCGEGAFTAALHAAGTRPSGIDVATEPLRRARRTRPELDFRQTDGPLPFAAAEFDVAWAGELLEHVQDGTALLDEVRRVLRPGGRLLVSTPDHPRRRVLGLALSRAAFERHFDPRSDHVRFFTRTTLGLLLEEAGFTPTQITSRRGVLLGRAER